MKAGYLSHVLSNDIELAFIIFISSASDFTSPHMSLLHRRGATRLICPIAVAASSSARATLQPAGNDPHCESARRQSTLMVVSNYLVVGW